MSEEFQVGEHTYRTTRKLNVFVQDKLIRRLSPPLSGAAPALVDIAAAMGGKDLDKIALADLLGKDVLDGLGPIAKALASVPDEDADFIFSTCLGVVTRRQPGGTGWSPVMSSGGLMFDDLGLMDMYQLAWRVLSENLSSFFASLGLTISQPGQDEESPS
jgi:hypothetical protein